MLEKIKCIFIRLRILEKIIKNGNIATNISFYIDENGHLIQTNN